MNPESVPVARLQAAAATRPGWGTAGTSLAQRTLPLEAPTEDRWSELNLVVRWDGQRRAYDVSVQHWWTQSGWTGRQFRRLWDGYADTAEAAFDEAEREATSLSSHVVCP